MSTHAHEFGYQGPLCNHNKLEQHFSPKKKRSKKGLLHVSFSKERE